MDNPLKEASKPVKGLLMLICGVVLLFSGYGAIVGVIFILFALMLLKE